jgi:CBS domain-containing protein
MRCADVMRTEIKLVHEEDSVQTAAQLMRKWNIGFLPVCDALDRVVGTLTDRDIAVRLCAEDWQASTCPVRDVMSSQVLACSPQDDLETADALMAEFQKSRIMVLDAEDRLRGVISLSDVAAEAAPGESGRVLREITTRETRLS